jgi:hypothetical protein
MCPWPTTSYWFVHLLAFKEGWRHTDLVWSRVLETDKNKTPPWQTDSFPPPIGVEGFGVGCHFTAHVAPRRLLYVRYVGCYATIWNAILDIQGLQSPASRTGLSSPLDLTVANSAPGYYSRNWAYSPCADHHKLLLVKSCFFLNKFVNILNTQVLSHSARRTRLDSFDPWSQTTISDNGVCSSERTARASTAHSIHKPVFSQWDPRTSYF